MLRYIFSQVDGEKNASEIVKSINVLMAIEWGTMFAKELSTIHVMNYPRDKPIEDDPFEGEEPRPTWKL